MLAIDLSQNDISGGNPFMPWRILLSTVVLRYAVNFVERLGRLQVQSLDQWSER